MEENRARRVVDMLRERFQKVTSGKPAGLGSVDVAAMTFPPQMATVEDHVNDAVSKGARVLAGGHAAPDSGRFFAPTRRRRPQHEVHARGNLWPPRCP